MYDTAVFPLQSGVTIVFLDPDFVNDANISAICIHLRQI